MKKEFNLVLDVGTTGVKGFIFDSTDKVIFRSYAKLDKQTFNHKVEQNPFEILEKSKLVLRQAVNESGIEKENIKNFGIANQRETVIAWDKLSGKTVYPAIVWEDFRTQAYCKKIGKKYNKLFLGKIGLSVNAYFSASKMHWILNHVKEAKLLAEKKRLLFGTVDSWILWNFDKSHPHITDQTNASRTLLYNIREFKWDNQLLDIFGIDRTSMAKVQPSKSAFGKLNKNILGVSLPINAMCGDQQASTFAAGTTPYSTKVTFGTGTFVTQVQPKFVLKSDFYTILIPTKSKNKYALEAKIEQSGKQVDEVLNHKAKLEQIINQLAAKTVTILKKLPVKPKQIIVDGGISQSDLLLEILNKKTKAQIIRQSIFDGTALGVAKLLAKK